MTNKAINKDSLCSEELNDEAIDNNFIDKKQANLSLNDLSDEEANDKSEESKGQGFDNFGFSDALLRTLKEKGYKNIYNMIEGVVGDEKNTGWITRGYPIVECQKDCD